MTPKIAVAMTVCTAVVISNLAGCSSSGHQASDSKAPLPVSSTATITDPAGKSLPIDAYQMTSDQYQKINGALISLQVSCMKRFGFDYRPYVTPATGPSGPDRNAHLYGPVDLSAASQHGYHRADTPKTADPASVPHMSDAMLSVLGSGAGPKAGPAVPATYNGIAVPKGGCAGEAEDKLGIAGKDLGLHGTANQISADGFNHSMNDDRVKAAFASWSACMKAGGYSYSTPNDAANDRRWSASSTPSPTEIAVATADVKCKQQANVVGIWFSVESAYEEKLIEQHATDLAQVKNNIDDALRKADAAVGSAK